MVFFLKTWGCGSPAGRKLATNKDFCGQLNLESYVEHLFGVTTQVLARDGRVSE
jgi:hypothetical protein